MIFAPNVWSFQESVRRFSRGGVNKSSWFVLKCEKFFGGSLKQFEEDFLQ